jgi:antitoxin PrlF
MTRKIYKASWARIGNSSGYRLSGSFFKENPQFSEVGGTAQVIDSDTILIRREAQEQKEQKEDELMLSLFLGSLMKQSLSNSSEIEAYTEAMAAEDDALIAGVVVGEANLKG